LVVFQFYFPFFNSIFRVSFLFFYFPSPTTG